MVQGGTPCHIYTREQGPSHIGIIQHGQDGKSSEKSEYSNGVLKDEQEFSKAWARLSSLSPYF